MNNWENFGLEEFSVSFLERAGAVVEKAGYALFEILLPDELIPLFNQNHLILAFDYEVAQETPGSIFVTHGSQVLDTIVRLSGSYGRFTRLYWPGAVLSFLPNAEQQAQKAVEFVNCPPPRLEMQWVAEHALHAFFFRTTFRSFEKTEEIFPVVVDGYSGLPLPDFLKLMESVSPVEKPDYAVSQVGERPVADLYNVACREVESKVRARVMELRRSSRTARDRELDKIDRYYKEVIKEIEQKMKSVDDEKRRRLSRQLAATAADKERRQKDAALRYDVEAEVRLDHLVVYHLPYIHLKLEVRHKKQLYHQTLAYNPLVARVEAPACPLCGKPAGRLVPTDQGQLVCAEHG
ncbi:MAG: hypothetical protein AB1510_06105 [Bacillota bacterium]